MCTAVRSVSKKDAISLVTNFGSMKAAMNAGKEEVVLIQGWGQKKAERWERAAREPFRVRKTMGTKEREGRIGSLEGERARTGDADALARKLGIGPVVLPESMTQSQTQAITIPDEDDEDAIIAVREREREERERNTGGGDDSSSSKSSGGAGHDKIMDALAKLRAAG